MDCVPNSLSGTNNLKNVIAFLKTRLFHYNLDFIKSDLLFDKISFFMF